MTSFRMTLALGAVALGAALAPANAVAANCKLTKDEQYHRANNKLPTYTRALSASGGAKCTTAHKFIKAYYKCRVAKPKGGKGGKCTKKVMGFKCTERRFNILKSNYDAKVSCKKGRQRIKTEYTQYT